MIPRTASAAVKRTARRVESPPAAGRRILVVDDNEDGAETLRRLLVTLGNDVHVAQDGLEAVETALHFSPSVTIMDLSMPRMDGFEAARRMRKLPNGQDMLLIALTGMGHQDALNRSREAGFDHHLVKPVDFGALRRLIANSLPH